jgi:hypothetical protein
VGDHNRIAASADPALAIAADQVGGLGSDDAFGKEARIAAGPRPRPPRCGPLGGRHRRADSVGSPAMLRHILLLQQRPDATADEIDACRAGLASLVGPIHHDRA